LNNKYPDAGKEIVLSFEIANGYSISPNPNNGKFSIYAIGQNDNKLEVTVLDLSGRQIAFQKFNQTPCTMDISSYEEGAYLLKIYDGNNTYFKKIIYE
jgi:hypothetical protein